MKLRANQIRAAVGADIAGASNLTQAMAGSVTNITADTTLTGVAGITPGSVMYFVIVGSFTVTFAGTAFNANGATQASGDGAMITVVFDKHARPCWSANKLV